MTLEWLIDALGWLGMIVLVVAYYLVSHGKWSPGAVRYNLANAGASVLVGLNALYHGALPSAGLNVVWVLIGLNALRLSRKLGDENPGAGEA
jgi:hypothetical protein